MRNIQHPRHQTEIYFQLENRHLCPCRVERVGTEGELVCSQLSWMSSIVAQSSNFLTQFCRPSPSLISDKLGTLGRATKNYDGDLRVHTFFLTIYFSRSRIDTFVMV